MRQIQITIPNEPDENLKNVLTLLRQTLKIKYMIVLKGEHNSLIILRGKPVFVADIIEKLNAIGVGVNFGIIDILNIETTIPEYAGMEKVDKKEKEIKKRISLQEIKVIIEEGAKPTFNYFLFTIVSAIIACAGLILNSAAIIIASMILSPLMGPILGVSFGAISKTRPLIKDGFICQLFGVLIAIGIGAVLGAISFFIAGSTVITQEMEARNFPNYLDITIAIASGMAVGFCVTGGIAATLVGVAIAVSLMPPAVNVGLALIYGDPALSLGSLTLLIVNIFAINLSAILIFKIKDVKAPPEMMAFWRGPTESIEERPEKKGLSNRIKKIFKHKKKS